MESLEEFDVVRALNFKSSRVFLHLVETELAGLIARACNNDEAPANQSDNQNEMRYVLTFPPLQPKYAQLLHATLVRFNLSFTVQGWRDERRIVVEATTQSRLPQVRVADFSPQSTGELVPRLSEVAKPAAVPKASLPTSTAVPIAASVHQEHDDAERVCPPPVKRSRNNDRKDGGGMRGWSDDDSDDEPSPTVITRNTRGRGFKVETPQEEAKPVDTNEISCSLTGDYTKYEIDPNDTWTPHRKPYVELSNGWEFSHAWSFIPEEKPGQPQSDGPVCGVASWKVEHETAQAYAVVFSSSSREARQWLDGNQKQGAEPYTLEIRPVADKEYWQFRFGRVSSVTNSPWKDLPWTNKHRTTFWAATYVDSDDGRRYLCMGLDVFPERRFFAARIAAAPQILGFGITRTINDWEELQSSFYIRDICVFARRSLVGRPRANRDHFVEAKLPQSKVLEVLKTAELQGDVAGVLPVQGSVEGESEGCCLIVSRSTTSASSIVSAFKEQGYATGVTALMSLQWTWPPSSMNKDDTHFPSGVDAVQDFTKAVTDVCRELHVDTLRELGLFKEHVERNTKHLEGTRLARTAAMRMILSGLSGKAPAPPAPAAGV